MQNGMKLFWLTGLVSAFGALALQGCGDDSEDGGTGGAAGASGGSTAKGGSGGGSSGGSTSKGGTTGAGGSSGGNTSKGGTTGAGGSTGGSAQGGEPAAGGDGPGAGGAGNEPSQACLDFCTGPDSIQMECGDEDFFPPEWDGAGCLQECADFPTGAKGLPCWETHKDNAANADNPGEHTLHCGHAVGEPDNGQCDER
jgi:hypothetical protein